MSLLAELLSRIKHPETRKDIPPGLRRTVSIGRYRELGKRRIILISTLLIAAIVSGFLAVYIMQSLIPSVKMVSEMRISKREPIEGVEVIKPQKEGKVKEEEKQPLGKPPIQSEKVMEKAKAQEGKETIIEEKPPKKERLAEPEGEKAVEVEGQKKTVEKEKAAKREGTRFIYIAKRYEKKGIYGNAILNYKKALNLKPDNYILMNKIASLYIEMNLIDEALKFLKMAYKINEDYIPVLTNMGIIYAKKDKFKLAEKFLLKAIALDGFNKAAILNVAILYEKYRMFDKARTYYSKLNTLGDPRGISGLMRIKKAQQ